MSKSAIVTGGARGIGLQICKSLSAAEYHVGIFDNDAEECRRQAEKIDNAKILVGDVSNAEDVSRVFDEFGQIPDLVVNNAGIVRFGPFYEQSIEDFVLALNINLTGSYLVSREAVRRLKGVKPGHIINLTSINAISPGPNTGAYPAAKAGVAHFTKQFALECGPYNIRFNAIAPGFIDGGMSTPIYADPNVRALRSSGVPINRLGTPEDIANAVLFLDSDAASYINGHELVVDGGVVHSLLSQLPRE